MIEIINRCWLLVGMEGRIEQVVVKLEMNSKKKK